MAPQIQQQNLEQEAALQESIKTVQEQAQQQVNDISSQLKAKVSCRYHVVTNSLVRVRLWSS